MSESTADNGLCLGGFVGDPIQYTARQLRRSSSLNFDCFYFQDIIGNNTGNDYLIPYEIFCFFRIADCINFVNNNKNRFSTTFYTFLGAFSMSLIVTL